VCVDRIAALFWASDSFRHTPIAAPAARSVPGTFFAALSNAVTEPGTVFRSVAVPESPTVLASANVTRPVGSADSVTWAPSSANEPFVFFQNVFA
jgi:hypothetical protein